jgi:hypothetical protein
VTGTAAINRRHLLLVAAAHFGAALPSHAEDTMEKKIQPARHPYVGMWVTADGHIRHELLPDNRYDEARGSRKSAYQGRYLVTGDHIDYWDDTGFTADGDFVDGVLYHAGMVLYREK